MLAGVTQLKTYKYASLNITIEKVGCAIVVRIPVFLPNRIMSVGLEPVISFTQLASCDKANIFYQQ